MVWDGKTPGVGFRHVGSPNTGLYLNTIGDVGTNSGKRWNEKLAGTETNRKVGQGSVNVMTNNGNRLYVAGTFDRSTNNIASGDWIQNIATIADYKDVAATWKPVDNGCDNTVRQLVIFKGDLYAGGDFSVCGGQARNEPTGGIARIKADVATTRRWRSLGLGVEGGVQAMIVVGGVFKNVLAVGGSFTSADGSGFNNFAFWTGETWQTMVPTRCDDACDNNPLGVLMAKGTEGYLGARVSGPIHSLIATDKIWAVAANAQTASSGNTAARELIYYNGGGWYRPTNGAVVGGADNFNAFLAVNGTDGSVMLANGAFAKNGLAAIGGQPSNMLHIRAGETGTVHRFNVFPGHQGTDAAINHFAGAGSVTVSLAVLAAVLLAAL
jgi:hypothetical protein